MIFKTSHTTLAIWVVLLETNRIMSYIDKDDTGKIAHTNTHGLAHTQTNTQLIAQTSTKLEPFI